MGHDEVGCETRGGVLLDNLPLEHWRRGTLGAVRRPDRSWSVLTAGVASLAVPILVHGTVMRAPALRSALEMMLAFLYLSAAWLLRAQFLASRQVRDLVLVSLALALGLATICFDALPSALNVGGSGYLSAAGLWAHLFVAGMFAAAAASPAGKMVGPRRAIRIGALLALGPVATAALGGLIVNDLGIDPTSRVSAPGEAFLIGLVLGATALLLYAAGSLARDDLRRPDRVLGLLSVTALLLTGAGLSDLTVRTLPGGAIGIGAVLQVLAATMLLGAAVVLERRIRSRLERAAALAERRRVARDLHDGIAQDLAFIAAHGAQIASEMGEEHPVVIAARRALAVSRSTISDLSDPAGASAGEALDAVAQELRDRFDVAIAVHAQIDGQLPSRVGENVSRIAREAIANAARHGQARNVLVSLRQAPGGIMLRVVDDGCGIVVDDRGSTPEGFGLRSMRERAGAMGGHLTVRRVPQGGTELEVVLP